MVIRGEGPKGGPGMPEMLTPTSAIMGAGLGKVSVENSVRSWLVVSQLYLKGGKNQDKAYLFLIC